MAQNIYDDPLFFQGYEELRRTASGLNDALELPSMRRLLPDLAGLDILDIGCGFGDFAREARQLGANSVVGIDLSTRMLEHARRETADDRIEYLHMAIEDLSFGDRHFDLAISSLALHYVADYTGALRRIAALLGVGGRLVFSVEHPICTALPDQQWHRDTQGRALHWPVDTYRDEGPRQTRWFVDGVVKYHRTIETYVNGLLDAGFRIVRLEEPEPVTAVQSGRADLELHRRRPPLLLLSAKLDLRG